MIGIRSTLPACNCMKRLYDRGIYRRINAELPSSVNDVPIDEVNLGCASPFEVLQHGCLRVAVAIQDFNEPKIIRFSRNTSSVPSRWYWIDKHLLWSDSACQCYRESFVVRSTEQLASFRSIDVRTHCQARDRPDRGNRAVEQELGPDSSLKIWSYFCIYCTTKPLTHPFASIAFATTKLSYQKVAGIGLLIYPGPQHCGGEVRESAEHASLPELTGKHLWYSPVLDWKQSAPGRK